MRAIRILRTLIINLYKSPRDAGGEVAGYINMSVCRRFVAPDIVALTMTPNPDSFISYSLPESLIPWGFDLIAGPTDVLRDIPDQNTTTTVLSRSVLPGYSGEILYSVLIIFKLANRSFIAYDGGVDSFWGGSFLKGGLHFDGTLPFDLRMSTVVLMLTTQFP